MGGNGEWHTGVLGSYCSMINILCDDGGQFTVFGTPLFPKFKKRGVFNSFP
jgi:hypothetical protein